MTDTQHFWDAGTSTMYVVTLLALYLLDLFYERCGDITLVRRMCKHAAYHGDVI